MLSIERRQGEWTEVIHRSGDVLRVCFVRPGPGGVPRAVLAFEDDAGHFRIVRAEAKVKRPKPPRARPNSDPTDATLQPPLRKRMPR